MRMDLNSLLSNILTARGYDVEDTPPLEGASGASYPVTLVAERDGSTRIVDALASRQLRAKDAKALASIVDDVGVDGAIVLALQGLEDGATRELDDRIELWDETQAVEAAGTWLFADALSDKDVDEIGPTTKVEPETTAPTPAPESSGSNGERPTEPEQAPEPVDPQSAPQEPAQATPDPVDDGSDAEILTDDPEPEPEPSQPAAQADPQTDTENETSEDPPKQEFVDPDDMIERAEKMLQGDVPDDGDAELIVEDDGPSEPEPTPAPEASEQEQSAREPEPESVDPSNLDPADDGSDAEILTDDPEPEPEPTEPETAEPEDTQTRTTTPQPPSSTSASPAAAAGSASEAETVLSGGTIEPELDAEKAQAKAARTIEDVQDTRLELLPFHVFEYEATLEGDGHTRNVDGTLWVSEQSGAVVDAPEGELVPEPSEPHERFRGSKTREETRQAAVEHLEETLEFRDEVRQEYSESAVIERVVFSPREGSIQLEDRGKAHAPRWRVEGSRQTVFVDAVTGETVTQ